MYKIMANISQLFINTVMSLIRNLEITLNYAKRLLEPILKVNFSMDSILKTRNFSQIAKINFTIDWF